MNPSEITLDGNYGGMEVDSNGLITVMNDDITEDQSVHSFHIKVLNKDGSYVFSSILTKS